ncbi:Sugar isomerase (SIS) [Penicillium soppii]|uniref:Sugar isomerase (SIS) n=1 Tax=Penicillium soppii TaxID=69789 RepID=UPI002548EE34|nr:Sugar isomerase (SIS) [Penicillium soppii]KAJ5856213.1 Sugar isomerase (SIS) [Penicillium soppii]
MAVSEEPVTWPPTPPCSSDPPIKDVSSVVTAIHVISTERAALAHLEHIYQTDERAQHDLARAVDQIARSVREGSKLVVCGVGKSGKVGRKIEATMNSLGVYSAFLHPTEALHGDLGLIRPNDTVLLISFSGRSPELLTLLPHLPSTVPVIALTSHTHPASCPLLSLHAPSGMGILLPAPIHEDEESSFGVSAPTSSTTVALALGDALAIATARKLHTATGKSPSDVFRGFHPGGAIGAASAGTPPTSSSSGMSTTTFDSPTSSLSLPWEDITNTPLIPPFTLQSPSVQCLIPQDIIVPLEQIPLVAPSPHSNGEIRLLDILLTAIQNPNAKSWVFISPSSIIPPRRVRALLLPGGNMDMRVSDVATNSSGTPFTIPRTDWLLVPASTPLADLRRLVSEFHKGSNSVSVIGLMKDMTNPDSCMGVVEFEDLLGD